MQSLAGDLLLRFKDYGHLVSMNHNSIVVFWQSVASVVEDKLMKLGIPDQGQDYPIVTGISEAGSRKRKKA